MTSYTRNSEMDRNSKWMTVSGVLGLLFFVIANFTELFTGLNELFGVLQIAVNIFVFFTWLRGFNESRGFKRFVAAWGVVIPFIMTAITLFRVIIPTLF